MRSWLALALVVALVGFDAWRGDLDRREAEAGPREPIGAVADAAALPRASARPRRDPFRFADAAPFSLAPDAPEPTPPLERPAATAPAAAAPVRLIGFIRQAGELRAALSIEGRVSLVAEGETVDGYSLLSLDAETGVRLRDPQGHEQELPLGD